MEVAVEEPRPGYTAVGRVLRPHGIRGELRCSAFSPAAPNLQADSRVFLAGSERAVRVVRARPDKGGWILEVFGINTRDGAEALIGTLIEAADKDVRRDDPDSFFVHELIGLRVLTDEGEELGIVSEVLQMGAADVYVVRGPKGEILFPAISDIVKEIDIAKQFMRITLLPGMSDDSK